MVPMTTNTLTPSPMAGRRAALRLVDHELRCSLGTDSKESE